MAHQMIVIEEYENEMKRIRCDTCAFEVIARRDVYLELVALGEDGVSHSFTEIPDDLSLTLSCSIGTKAME